MMNQNELYHHGIKGMKWGVRRYQNTDGSLTAAGKKRYDDYDSKKAAYKTAKKEYDKSFNKAYNKAIAAYSPIKKHREANDARWEDAYNKADAMNKAKAEYKTSKKALKEYQNKQKNSAKAEKSVYANERDRQKKHIAAKRAVKVGQMAVNGILARNNVTLNGKSLRVSQDVITVVNHLMDRKYAKDYWKD